MARTALLLALTHLILACERRTVSLGTGTDAAKAGEAGPVGMDATAENDAARDRDAGAIDASGADTGEPKDGGPVDGGSPTGLEILPSVLDFGLVTTTCPPVSMPIDIRNVTSMPIDVTALSIESAGTAFQVMGATPARIDVGMSLRVSVQFTPNEQFRDSGTLWIETRLGRFSVGLRGEGVGPAGLTEVFSQLSQPKADILFVLDNSGSMISALSALPSEFSAFVTFAETEDLDFQLALTTADVSMGGEAGRFVGSPAMITSAHNDPATAFQNLVSIAAAGSGGGEEQGLEASHLALTEPLVSTTNSGFLRDTAALAVIYISNEDDASPQAPTWYLDALRSLEADGLLWVNAIVGTVDPSCDGAVAMADMGRRYLELVSATSGEASSICDAGWARALSSFGRDFGLLHRFELHRDADPATVTVRVEGVRVEPVGPAGETNWTFAGERTLVFSREATPGRSDEVGIHYTPACP